MTELRFSVSARGMALAQMMPCANRLELLGRPLRVELEALDQLKLPAILHWNFNHFAVLTRVDGRNLVLHDPPAAKWYCLGSKPRAISLAVDHFKADVRMQKYRLGNTLLFGGNHILVIWLGALLILDQPFSVGIMFAFLAYKDLFTNRIIAHRPETITSADRVILLQQGTAHNLSVTKGSRVTDAIA